MGKRQENSTGTLGVVPIVVTLIVMAGVSGLLLLLLSVLTYYMELSAGIARIGILVIYVISCFTGGYLLGRMKREKKFLWGLGAGLGYFLLLLVVSMARDSGAMPDVVQLLIVLVLTGPAGMIGGMVS